MDVIVVGTHQYQWALWPWSALFRKYWGPDRVTYVGDRLVGSLPEGMKFVTVPAYSGGQWPWEHWFGAGLKSALAQVGSDPVVALFLPDHWICQPVDREKVASLERYVLEFPTLRANLTGGLCLDGYGERIGFWEGLEMVSVSPHSRDCGQLGGTSMAPALWDRKRFHDLLEPGWSLWATEEQGTAKFARSGQYPGVRSVGTRPALLRRTNGLSHGRERVVLLEELVEEDREMVRGCLPRGWEALG